MNTASTPDEEGFRLAEELLFTPDLSAMNRHLATLHTPEERLAYLDSIGFTAEAAGRAPDGSRLPKNRPAPRGSPLSGFPALRR